MPKVALSRAFVARATCDSGKAKVDYFDSDQRGFMFEVRRSGGKTFYQRYTDERGRERQYKIGPADVLALDQARKKARVILAQALLGDDPQARRRELREIPTLAELVRDRYLPHVRPTNAAGAPTKPSSGSTSCRCSDRNRSTRSTATPLPM